MTAPAQFQIGNIVTCKVGAQVFNADIIGKNAKTYIVRDYAIGRAKALDVEQMTSHNVDARFKGIKDWRYIDEDFVSRYDSVTRSPPKIYDHELTQTLGKVRKPHCDDCERAEKKMMERLG